MEFLGGLPPGQVGCAAFVDIISVVDAVPDAVIHTEKGCETADQCPRDRTAVRAEVCTPIVQSLPLKMLIESLSQLCPLPDSLSRRILLTILNL